MRSVSYASVRGRRDRGNRASSGAATGGPWAPGDRDDDERGQVGAAGATGRRGHRDGRAGCGVGGRGGGRGTAGRHRARDDGAFGGAQRQAQLQTPRAARRHHQPPAHRWNGPPAGRRRGDRGIPRRRAERRHLDRNRRWWTSARGGPAAVGGGGAEDAPDGRGAPLRRGRCRQDWWDGPAIRGVLRVGRQRRLGRARAEAAVPACRGRHRLLQLGASRRRGQRHRPGVRAKGERRVQHRGRRACPGPGVAPVSRRNRRAEAAHAAAQVGGSAASRRNGEDGDRGARLFQCQSQAGARLGAALSVMAAGFQGRVRVTRDDEFEELRPLLFAIAYRILGSVAEAEDAVQETWLRYQSSPTQPISAKAFLSAVVTRVSIDVLRSARVRREAYVGQWFPEPLLTDPYEDPARSAELADSMSMAALLLLERLTPLERAAFVLREVFGFGFPEIASAIGRSEAACRQLAARARRHMDTGRPRFEADRREREELAERFFDAFREGDIDGVKEVLAADVEMARPDHIGLK